MYNSNKSKSENKNENDNKGEYKIRMINKINIS